MNPPAIQVIEPTTEAVEMDTAEEASVPPITPELPLVEQSRNPFLNVVELMGEGGIDNGHEEMSVDDKNILPLPPQRAETNPFRKLSGEHQRSGLNVAGQDEIGS